MTGTEHGVQGSSAHDTVVVEETKLAGRVRQGETVLGVLHQRREREGGGRRQLNVEVSNLEAEKTLNEKDKVR